MREYKTVLDSGLHAVDSVFVKLDFRLLVSGAVDCSQSPIFPCDRRDRARLTVNGGHLDFQSYRGGGRRGL